MICFDEIITDLFRHDKVEGGPATEALEHLLVTSKQRRRYCPRRFDSDFDESSLFEMGLHFVDHASAIAPQECLPSNPRRYYDEEDTHWPFGVNQTSSSCGFLPRVKLQAKGKSKGLIRSMAFRNDLCTLNNSSNSDNIYCTLLSTPVQPLAPPHKPSPSWNDLLVCSEQYQKVILLDTGSSQIRSYGWSASR